MLIILGLCWYEASTSAFSVCWRVQPAPNLNTVGIEYRFIHLVIFFFYVSYQCPKGFFYVEPWFSTNLHVFHAVLTSQILCIVSGYFSFNFEICFRSNQYFINSFCCTVVDLFDPRSNILERCLVCDWKCNKNTCGSFVKSISNIFESFLACCVPDLQSNRDVVEPKLSDFKIDADGGNVSVLKPVFTVASDEVSFANSAITNH